MKRPHSLRSVGPAIAALASLGNYGARPITEILLVESKTREYLTYLRVT